MPDEPSINSGPILHARNLSRVVQTDNRSQTIIDDLSYDFDPGKIYTIVGPSGAGKSSLLRLFNRLDEKTGGEVRFHGRPADSYPVTELRKRIALLFQEPYLFSGTITDNLIYCCPDRKNADPDFTAHYLSLVGLDPALAERSPEKLSVGQKQRVALARILVLEPEILLLDEPTSALDPGAARTIEELIMKLNRELQLTIIMVTHNFRQALRLEGISLVVVNGRLIESGQSKTIFERPSNEITRRFVNGDLR
jgi:putative ABC transport system ATP-binding protein